MQDSRFNLTARDAQEVAWKYFEQHASQRVSFFNFFIVLASSMLLGVVAAIAQFEAYIIGVIAGFVLTFTTIIFWKIDERNKMMTKMGEEALKEFERDYTFVNAEEVDPDGCPWCAAQIFSREAWKTEQLREREAALPPWRRQLSMSKSLRLVYWFFGMVGLASAAVGFAAILRSPAAPGPAVLTIPQDAVITIQEVTSGSAITTGAPIASPLPESR